MAIRDHRTPCFMIALRISLHAGAMAASSEELAVITYVTG
jgi:hypothetical protein